MTAMPVLLMYSTPPKLNAMVLVAAAASTYASRSTVSVVASTSEGRSMIAAPSADRTLRRSPAVAIVTFFASRDNRDHPPRSVGAHVLVLDPVPDRYVAAA